MIDTRLMSKPKAQCISARFRLRVQIILIESNDELFRFEPKLIVEYLQLTRLDTHGDCQNFTTHQGRVVGRHVEDDVTILVSSDKVQQHGPVRRMLSKVYPIAWAHSTYNPIEHRSQPTLTATYGI